LLESLVGLAGEHGVEDLEADRATVMYFQRLQVLDHVVGAFAGDVGGNLVARRVQGRTGVQQNVRDPTSCRSTPITSSRRVLRSDHPQVQHARRVAAGRVVPEKKCAKCGRSTLGCCKFTLLLERLGQTPTTMESYL
jgi:hypothetical protein